MSKSYCKLIYDGGDVIIPSELGSPRNDQMVGTTFEQLVELASRSCYDSLGKKESRSTKGNLEHIVDVGHYSVLRHANVKFKIKLTDREYRWLFPFIGRPGVYLASENSADRYIDGNVDSWENGSEIYLTANFESIMRWQDFTKERGSESFRALDISIGEDLISRAKTLAPIIFNRLKSNNGPGVLEFVDKPCLNSAWVTLLIVGSRGMTHEFVRHSYKTAISQRSTRFVDESKSEWIIHPHDPSENDGNVYDLVNKARSVYSSVKSKVKEALVGKGLDATTARKQAMGTARGYLGNALKTYMVFSASMDQWIRIILARASDAADAEIRAVAISALECLRNSKHSKYVNHIKTKPAKDGAGLVAYVDSECARALEGK